MGKTTISKVVSLLVESLEDKHKSAPLIKCLGHTFTDEHPGRLRIQSAVTVVNRNNPYYSVVEPGLSVADVSHRMLF